MPQRLKTLCRYPGCKTPTRDRYCGAHASTAWRNADARRGTPGDRGYDAAWYKLAALRRRLDFGLCQHCKAHGFLTPAKTVDHIIPIYVRPDWRLALGNTQVLCDPCHKRKTSDDIRRYGRREGPLTPQKTANRRLANELADPPRTDEGLV